MLDEDEDDEEDDDDDVGQEGVLGRSARLFIAVPAELSPTRWGSAKRTADFCAVLGLDTMRVLGIADGADGTAAGFGLGAAAVE